MLFWLQEQRSYYGIVLEESKHNVPEANKMFN